MIKKYSVDKPLAYSWLLFFLGACFLFYKYILQVSPAVMTTDLMRTYSLTGTTLGFLVGFYFYTYMVMQIPSGILLDKYGVRKVTSLAILLCACGVLLFSQTSSFALACIGRLLIGFGAAFATTSYMKIAGTWFPAQYFALLSGFFGTACMAGAGTAEAPLAWLVNQVGWRNTLVFCALLGFILCVLFWFVVKENKSKHTQKITANAQQFRWCDLIDLFRNKSNWPLIIYGGCAFTPVSVFGGLWGVPFIMAAYHLTKTSAASSVSLAFFGFAAGGIIVGWIGKQLTKQWPVITIGAASSLFFLLIILYVPHLPVQLLNGCIFLFGLGASGFLQSYTIAKNINSATLIATVIGVFNMGDPLCGALAEPLIGKILDLHWDGLKVDDVRIFSVHAYQLGLSVLVGYLLVALICCFFIKEKK